MARRLRGRRHPVLEKSFRRAPGDGAEVVDQVRLVVVPALDRDSSPLGSLRSFSECPRPIEAQQTRDRLRRQADLLAEASDDPLAAPPELLGKRANGASPVRLEQESPG